MKLFLIIIGFLAMSQTPTSVWSTLSMVTVVKEFDPEYGIEKISTDVGPLVQALDGTEITVDGYIIPLTGQVAQNHFMFSRYPQNMCFFCGKAGPESAMQVFLKNNNTVAFTTDKINITGTLKVYNDQSSGLIYTLESAVVNH